MAPIALGLIWRCRNSVPGGAGHPFKNIRLEPTDVFPSESLSSRKLPDCHHAAKHPWRPPDKTSDIMGCENLIPCRVGFIHPPGDRDSLTYADAARLDAILSRICQHKRPSMWFRSFRVKSPRMGDDAPDSRCMPREVRGIFRAKLLRGAKKPTMQDSLRLTLRAKMAQ
jgi:hypothetical protein